MDAFTSILPPKTSRRAMKPFKSANIRFKPPVTKHAITNRKAHNDGKERTGVYAPFKPPEITKSQRMKLALKVNKTPNLKVNPEFYKKQVLSKNEASMDLDSSYGSDATDISQAISDYLSQQSTCLDVPKFSSYKKKLEWLQTTRAIGTYVQCDTCDKFRFLKDVHDPLELSDYWYCFMNPDINYNRCSTPEQTISPYEEASTIENLYNAGSIVCGKIMGYPWWPAMVDDDPNIEQYYWLEEYSDVPTHYHVVFFDKKKVQRAWLLLKDIQPFKNTMGKHGDLKRYPRFKKRIEGAIDDASSALQLGVLERLRKHSFLTRWKKPIREPNGYEY